MQSVALCGIRVTQNVTFHIDFTLGSTTLIQTHKDREQLIGYFAQRSKSKI